MLIEKGTEHPEERLPEYKPEQRPLALPLRIKTFGDRPTVIYDANGQMIFVSHPVVAGTEDAAERGLHFLRTEGRRELGEAPR